MNGGRSRADELIMRVLDENLGGLIGRVAGSGLRAVRAVTGSVAKNIDSFRSEYRKRVPAEPRPPKPEKLRMPRDASEIPHVTNDVADAYKQSSRPYMPDLSNRPEVKTTPVPEAPKNKKRGGRKSTLTVPLEDLGIP
jgi:hypothetical protein